MTLLLLLLLLLLLQKTHFYFTGHIVNSRGEFVALSPPMIMVMSIALLGLCFADLLLVGAQPLLVK